MEMNSQEICDTLTEAIDEGKAPFHALMVECNDGDIYVPGVTYRQWLIGQLLLGAAPPIWQSRFDNERVADSIVSLVDAIIKRERQ